jgi:hypothetical protein
MSEKIPTPESKKEERFLGYKELKFMYPDKDKEVVQGDPEELVEKVEKLAALFDDFERTHDLEALHAITTLTSADTKVHPVRQPAMLDLPAIFELWHHLRWQRNVAEEKMKELHARYYKIQRAIGVLTDIPEIDTVDHSPRN